jgi:hypothetical protein
MGTQKLEGLMAICHDCHLCFHLGKGNVEGVLDQTLDRLAALNFWPKEIINQYRVTLDRRYSILSELYWMLDLSAVQHPSGGVTVKKPWKLHDEDPRLIRAPNKYGSDNLTVLLGTPWKFHGENDWRNTVISSPSRGEFLT